MKILLTINGVSTNLFFERSERGGEKNSDAYKKIFEIQICTAWLCQSTHLMP